MLKNYGFLKLLVPGAAKLFVRRRHSNYVLRRTLRSFSRLPSSAGKDLDILQRLTWSWGNQDWSGDPSYLAAALTAVVSPSTVVLECGTGLSTVLMGLATRDSGNQIYSLEHIPEWADRIRAELKRYGLDHVHVCTVPIISYDGFSWYDTASCPLPQSNFDVVICDGPPSSTAGGRYGLLPVMSNHLNSDCVILLDDIIRKDEQSIVKRWTEEFDLSLEEIGEEDCYARLVFRKSDLKARTP